MQWPLSHLKPVQVLDSAGAKGYSQFSKDKSSNAIIPAADVPFWIFKIFF